MTGQNICASIHSARGASSNNGGTHPPGATYEEVQRKSFLNADEDFSSVIFAKVNAPAVLREEVAQRSRRGPWDGGSVALGTATDSYQPIEGKFRITRGILSALRDFRVPVGIVTKGTMIVRDADLLAEMPGAMVSMSIPTLDEGVWAKLEPGTPPPRSRLRAVARLAAAGVRVGVALGPVVPGITDSEAGLAEVAKGAAEAGACFLEGRALYLMPAVKEHFVRFLEDQRPDLTAPYGRLYPAAYPARWYSTNVDEVIAGLRERQGLGRRPRAEEVSPPRQLALMEVAGGPDFSPRRQR